MTTPGKPEDEGDFLKDLGDIGNDEFTPRPRRPDPKQQPEPPRRVPINDGDEDYEEDEFGCDDAFMDEFMPDVFYIPIFSLGELDKGPLTDDDLDTIQRLKPFLDCVACNDEFRVCDQMFSHLAETAIMQISALSEEIVGVIGGLRRRIIMMGANTQDSVDLTVLTLAGEVDRLRRLIPKLHAAQEGMDSF